MSSQQYQQAFETLGKEGYRLVQVSGYGVGGQDLYAAIWEKASGPPQIARHGMSSEHYQQEFDKLGKDGYRLMLVNGYSVGGQDRYAAVWNKASGPPQVARHGMSSEQYQQEFDKLGKEGFRLVHVSGYSVYPSVGGQDRYAAIWEKASGPQQIARHGMNSEQYQQEFETLGKQGYRLVQLSGYSVGERARYAAIWEQASGPQQMARHGMSSEQYQQEFEKLAKQGYRLVQVSGYGVAE
jgi:hypothetical protein